MLALVGAFRHWRSAGGLSWRAWPWGLLATIALAEGTMEALDASVPVPLEAIGPDPRFVGRLGEHPVRTDLVAGPLVGHGVVFVGDSFTEGQGVHGDAALPAQVADGLRARGEDVDVRNLGLAGLDPADEAALYVALGAPLAPDVVVWVLVANDFGGVPVAGTDDLVVDRSVPPRTGLALVDRALRGWWARRLTRATEAAYHASLRTDTPAFRRVRALLAAESAAQRARGARLIVALYPLLHDLDAYPFAEEQRAIAGALADGGLEVVDLLPAFVGRDARALWASPRDHHPNAAAHALAAGVLVDALLAVPWPTPGPVDCAQVPAPAGLEALALAACVEPSPARRLAYVAGLVARDGIPGERVSNQVTQSIAATAAWATPEGSLERAAAVRLFEAVRTGGDAVGRWSP